MKKSVWVLLVLVIMSGQAFGATLNLKATWTANTEMDMKEYKVYRTDSGKTLIGVVSHPGSSLTFSITIPKSYPRDLTFVLTAVDQNNNESPESLTSTVDVTPPSAPRGIRNK